MCDVSLRYGVSLWKYVFEKKVSPSTDRTVFICFIELEICKYKDYKSQEYTDWAEYSFSRGQFNRHQWMPCNTCQLVTHTHTHKWTSSSSVEWVEPSVGGVNHSMGGGGGSVFFICHGSVLNMNTRNVNSLLLMSPHLVHADTQGCCSVACPQLTWMTKGRVGSLGPWTPEGSTTLIMFA